MKKEDKIRLRKCVQELKKWEDEGDGRCVFIVVGDSEGGLSVFKYSSCLRLSESIASAICDKPTLIFAMKLGVAAAEEYNRQKEEKKSKS